MECECALLIPPFGSPYADYATAETAIAEQTDSCIAFYAVSSSYGGLSASFNGTTFAVSGTDAGGGPGLGVNIFGSVYLLAGETLSAAYTASTDGSLSVDPSLFLYSCDYLTLIDSDSDPASSGTLTVTAPADGVYVVLLSTGATGGSSLALSADITSSGAFTVNPVIALWDDSVTTRKLWACPKLLLPPLTESTGTWYVDCAEAAGEITDRSSNCIGFFQSAVEYLTAFVATGTSSITVAATIGIFNVSTGNIWFGINAEAGETLSFAFTAGDDASWEIYDDTGTLIDFIYNTATSPWVSSALPYTGRYTILGAINSTSAPIAVTMGVTSSGTMSVNQIQALYDIGLDCPARLDCGDSC